MTAIQALLRDRKRAQRGSVLSGVLIMVAFLCIISGALMTELSTHFLISRTLVNRVGNEATVNSAMELALDQLQNTALGSACPIPAPVTLNLRTATVSYTSCWPTVDVRSAPGYTSVASTATFNVDGFHGTVNGQNLYLVGDSGGTIYQYQFGQSTPAWSLPLQSSITGPPLTMADVGASPPDPTDISNLVPIAGGGSSGCSANACVKLLQQDTNRPAPDYFCYMSANASVISRPAAGMASPSLVYFGDTSGTLWAYLATEAGHCALQNSISTPGNAAIVAGPIVFKNGAKDEIYVVTSTSQLLHYTYDPGDSPALSQQDNPLSLPFINPAGIALDQTSVPARVAITYAGGGVSIVNIAADYDATRAANTVVGPGFAAAPAWCSCPSGKLGMVGVNGTFYLYGANLSFISSAAVGQQVRTSPAPDGAGEWFFGAYDGYLYELQESPSGSTVTQVARFGSTPVIGQVKSSVQVGPCSAGICVYMGSVNNAYIVSLDARRAQLTACLSLAPPACSGDNPRLSAQVEVGVAGNNQTVHVQGWSYTSP
jgi:hypothetical protein